MRVVRSSPLKEYGEGGAWLHELQEHGFENDCCTILDFKPSEGGKGHTVAVHRKAADEFVFFDPNYGTYRYSKEQLLKCLQHLFWTPIKAAQDELDGDKAVYLRREEERHAPQGRWDKMAYTIFGV